MESSFSSWFKLGLLDEAIGLVEQAEIKNEKISREKKSVFIFSLRSFRQQFPAE